MAAIAFMCAGAGFTLAAMDHADGKPARRIWLSLCLGAANFIVGCAVSAGWLG